MVGWPDIIIVGRVFWHVPTGQDRSPLDLIFVPDLEVT